MNRLSVLIAGVSALTLTAPVAAQSMSGMDMKGMSMPGMKMPAASAKKAASKKPAAKGKAGKTRLSGSASRSKPGVHRGHNGHAMAKSMPGMDRGAMAGMDMSGATAKSPPSAGSMPGMQMPDTGMSGRDSTPMPGMAMGGMPAEPMTGTALAAGNAAAPAAPSDH